MFAFNICPHIRRLRLRNNRSRHLLFTGSKISKRIFFTFSVKVSFSKNIVFSGCSLSNVKFYCILCRYLQHLNYEVCYVRNFTDVDDKVGKLLWISNPVCCVYYECMFIVVMHKSFPCGIYIYICVVVPFLELLLKESSNSAKQELSPKTLNIVMRKLIFEHLRTQKDCWVLWPKNAYRWKPLFWATQNRTEHINTWR